MAINVPSSHYILMIQVNESPDGRRYSEYESLHALMEGITKLFDDFLKTTFPHIDELSYDVQALIKFLHSFKDLSCLVYQKRANMYRPQSKDWLMQELYKHLSKQSNNQ